MTYLLILLLVVAAMAAATVRLIAHDGRGPLRPPTSHADDPRFRAPLAR
jgi:hypothetical protein